MQSKQRKVNPRKLSYKIFHRLLFFLSQRLCFRQQNSLFLTKNCLTLFFTKYCYSWLSMQLMVYCSDTIQFWNICFNQKTDCFLLTASYSTQNRNSANQLTSHPSHNFLFCFHNFIWNPAVVAEWAKALPQNSSEKH